MKLMAIEYANVMKRLQLRSAMSIIYLIIGQKLKVTLISVSKYLINQI